MGDQKPSVARVVHFTEETDVCLAAVIAAVHEDGTLNLGYLSPTGGVRQIQNVAEGTSGATWHWPERVS